MEVMRKPKELQAKDKARARVAKKLSHCYPCFLNVGYSSLIERYQSEKLETLRTVLHLQN